MNDNMKHLPHQLLIHITNETYDRRYMTSQKGVSLKDLPYQSHTDHKTFDLVTFVVSDQLSATRLIDIYLHIILVHYVQPNYLRRIPKWHSLMWRTILFHKIDLPQPTHGQAPFSLGEWEWPWRWRWLRISCESPWRGVKHSAPMLHWCNKGGMGLACRKEILTYVNHWDKQDLQISTSGMDITTGGGGGGDMWRGGAMGGSLTNVADISLVFMKYLNVDITYQSYNQWQDQSPLLEESPQASWMGPQKGHLGRWDWH